MAKVDRISVHSSNGVTTVPFVVFCRTRKDERFYNRITKSSAERLHDILNNQMVVRHTTFMGTWFAVNYYRK